MPKIIVTNGGPHPPDRWADTTVEAIMDLIRIPDDSVTAEALTARQAKRGLSPKLFAILLPHHDGVQRQHRGALKKVKASQVGEQIDVTPHMDAADQALAALAATPFAAHFAEPHVQEVVRQIIGSHTASVIDIERRWHADALAKGA